MTSERKPRIVLTAQDHERLSILARTTNGTVQDAAAVLTSELDRAHVLAKGRHPEHTVFMGCEVEFRDDTTDKVQTVTLVYPGEADISQGKISVLTPIGAALIGMRAGHSITWETRAGDLKRLTVIDVREPKPV
ncbi:MAG TPA: nucleoside diphosphate kinase regulator [Beijerinckiaceae bacterium]|jgi:regulator of nucleoside diphosphate kinase|nr:nucleoside diphosphate kinase regulator [Beijerinckiaceae bacterium]